MRIYRVIRQVALKSTICGISHHASQTQELRFRVLNSNKGSLLRLCPRAVHI